MKTTALEKLIEEIFSTEGIDELCAKAKADGMILPYSGESLVRARWGLSVGFLALALDSLVDVRTTTLFKPLVELFILKLKEKQGTEVVFGQYIVTDGEIDFLKKRGIRRSLFFGINNSVVDSAQLLALVFTFRLNLMLQTLADLRDSWDKKRREQPLYHLIEQTDRNEERYSIIATALAVATLGRNISRGAEEEIFFVVLLSKMQKKIDPILHAFNE